MTVPEAYFDFIMAYAPYLYVTPGVGPDLTWGKASFAGAFAVDFLYEAHFDDQFDDRSIEIESKIVEIADWIVTQQNTDAESLSYGGFKSTESSTAYYSVDAGRILPALLKAYELTSNNAYLNSAKLAATYLYNMQYQPSQIGVHDRFYGGFARAVSNTGTWQQQMDVESLCSLIGLKMLCEVDSSTRVLYEGIIAAAVNFYRQGIEDLSLFFDPLPVGDGKWHRTGLEDDTIYDDSIAYALIGLYDNEGYSPTVQQVYESLNAIGSLPLYPAYNPAICWAGYINVLSKAVACDYYDGVTAGILAKIRKAHDKIAYDYSARIIQDHSGEFMFWGTKHVDYGYLENKHAMATVCWLGQLLIGYELSLTRFTQILNAKGESLIVYPVNQVGEKTLYSAGVDFKAIVLPAKIEETLIEPGYIINDFAVLHTFTPIRRQDKIRIKGVDYEVLTVQDFTFKNQIVYRKANLRRLQN